jgi:hypothetical protein
MVKNGKPSWTVAMYQWQTANDMMKNLLQGDRRGGAKSTRKHKKSKTQKGGRRHKKTRKH